jgi:hypothetical protein
MRAIFSMREHKSRVQIKVSAAGNKISPPGATSVASAFKQNVTLTYVNLEGAAVRVHGEHLNSRYMKVSNV